MSVLDTFPQLTAWGILAGTEMPHFNVFDFMKLQLLHQTLARTWRVAHNTLYYV